MSQLTPQPLQIISTGDSEESCLFRLNEENLSQIIDKIPPNMKVGIVAVVGAFRTGKSFLLNLFLRYLRNSIAGDESQQWMVSEGDELIEGNLNEGGWSLVNSGKEEEDKGMLQRQKSFEWRGGQKRQTTGIWMWSEPFIRATEATKGEKIAILLMDTQGMFDNETTMTLTAQIFGLSTLVSSFQIYNVDKRIQEDNLQHLALFSEYGRMALHPQDKQNKKKSSEGTGEGEVKDETVEEEKDSNGKSETTSTEPKTKAAREEKRGEEEEEEKQQGEKEGEGEKKLKKPFQRLQFLVRDWQNFDTEYSESSSREVFEKVQQEMQSYLEGVLRPRNASDLQSTRDQITRCFEKLDCFLLPHPGFEVTKKTYDGSISRISPDFRALLNRYVRIIFEGELEAKEVNQRAITGLELKTFFSVYAKMFQEGEKQFPKAMTMLEATAEANNRNAYDLAMKSYLDNMNSLLNPNNPNNPKTTSNNNNNNKGGEEGGYVKEMDFHQKHDSFLSESLRLFDEIATMGALDLIAASRLKLSQQIEVEKKRFHEVNSLKNPYRDMEYYILPLLVALASYLIAKIVDKTCSHDVCEAVEDTFNNIYLFVFFMMLVMGWRQIRKVFNYVKDLAPVLLNHAKSD